MVCPTDCTDCTASERQQTVIKLPKKCPVGISICSKCITIVNGLHPHFQCGFLDVSLSVIMAVTGVSRSQCSFVPNTYTLTYRRPVRLLSSP